MKGGLQKNITHYRDVLSLVVATSINVFSMIPTTGTITMNQPKYNAVAIAPIVIYGSSACWLPRYISKKKSITSTPNANFITGRNCPDRVRDVSRIGIANRISNDPSIPTTPSNLLGIDRRIAQKGNRYHSGTIEGGVCIGFAGMQLSLCPNRLGKQNTIVAKIKKNNRIVTRSLKMKYGCIGNLSEFDPTPNGLLLPFVCNVIRCMIARADNKKGSK